MSVDLPQLSSDLRAVGQARLRAVRHPPPETGRRAAWLFLGLALVTATLAVPLVLASAGVGGWARIGLLAGLGLIAWRWTGALLGGAQRPLAVLPEALGLLALGLGVGPSRVLALLYPGLLFRSLIAGSAARVALVVGAYAGAHVGAVLLTTNDRGGYGLTSALTQLPTLALVGAVMHLFARTLRNVEAAQVREHALTAELHERRAEERYRVLVQDASEVVTVMDADTTVRFQSAALQRVLGYEEGALVGSRLIDLVHPEDRDWVWRGYEASLPRQGITTDPIECRWRHRDGSYRWMSNLRNNLLHDPRVAAVVLTSRDVTDRRRLEEQLGHRALHDPLTELANRALFEEHVGQALASARRHGRHLAVGLIDLVDFKQVNDTLGHDAGDRLLVAVAERLTAAADPGDNVARVGGDTFALLVRGGLGASELVDRMRRVSGALRPPLVVDGRRLSVEARVGMVIATGTESPIELLRNADIAVNRAARGGGGRLEVYEDEMHASICRRLELEDDLRHAVRRDELVLHYQPVFEVDSGRPVGCEALLRWRHPRRGLLVPDAFLAVAEESGQIVPIGRWVIRAACAQAALWQREGHKFNVAVNLSGVELADAGLVEHVARTLADTALNPRRLVVEVTESVLLCDLEAAGSTLRRLKTLGVQVALDDFGTGWSSLAYLRSLPFDGLKIPKPFVERIVDGGHDFLLTRGIVQLCHALRLGTVAEGIESPEQLRCLRELGCDLGQGVGLAAPGEAEAVTALLREASGRRPGLRPVRAA